MSALFTPFTMMFGMLGPTQRVAAAVNKS